MQGDVWQNTATKGNSLSLHQKEAPHPQEEAKGSQFVCRKKHLVTS